MGELITKDKTGDWLTRIDASRQNLISAANSGSKMKAAFATADARAELIETLKDDEIKAKLLRISGADIGMVELANNPTDDDRVKWCAIAILSGFCPGEDQFAIFGGGKDRDGNAKPGKLYTKEAGFRTLFAHLGIVPEVAIGHPEFVPLGTSGKKVWRVGGKALCEYQGASYAVEFTGPAALGLPGYESDNVAGISAKARRQMLKALWAKVSPILTQDHSEPDEDTIPQDVPAAIGVTEPEKQLEPSETEKHEPSLNRIRQILQAEPDTLVFVESVWNEIAAARTFEKLEEAGMELATMKKSVSSQVLSLVRPFYQARQSELKGGAV